MDLFKEYTNSVMNKILNNINKCFYNFLDTYFENDIITSILTNTYITLIIFLLSSLLVIDLSYTIFPSIVSYLYSFYPHLIFISRIIILSIALIVICILSINVSYQDNKNKDEFVVHSSLTNYIYYILGLSIPSENKVPSRISTISSSLLSSITDSNSQENQDPILDTNPNIGNFDEYYIIDDDTETKDFDNYVMVDSDQDTDVNDTNTYVNDVNDLDDYFIVDSDTEIE